ncbi:MAG: 30S ribosomal protein S16 [Candidatus Cloacimonetes bacterium]|nr:30S ribosomal protein S16 [Candidatus Cloacimonadota bacterium]
MVKLRLKRMGKIDTPFYRIVVLDSRKKRDGAYIEALGYYDPKTDPLTLKVDSDKAILWLLKGAQPSETVRSLFKKAGILEKMHKIKLEKLAEKSETTKTKKPKKAAPKKTKSAAPKPAKKKVAEKTTATTEKKDPAQEKPTKEK